MVDWKKVRDDFPAATKNVYFISAGMSPIPNQVLDRVISEYRSLNEDGDIHWIDGLKRNEELKGKIGDIINASGDDISFQMNTSTAMSTIATSLKKAFGKNFNVVSMMDEFPASFVPFEYQGIDMRYVKSCDARYGMDAILDMMDGNTKAVLTSHVQFATGFRQDLLRLGAKLKNRDVLFIVNATQGFPYFPIDVKEMNIDAMSASLHKWGLAGLAGSIFYTSEDFRAKFPPPIAGWLSVEPGDDFIYMAKNGEIVPKSTADCYTMGSFNLQAINSFDAALSYMNSIGFENIRGRIFELTDYLISRLAGLDVKIVSPVEKRAERSASVSILAKGNEANLVKYLGSKGIYVSHRVGVIRISVNIFNDFNDIDRLTDEMSAFLSG